MAVDTTWTDPSTGGSIDLNTGNTLSETVWDKVLSNQKRLGGTDGNTKTGNYGIGATPSTWHSSAAALQVGSAALWQTTGGVQGFLNSNSYYDGSGYKAIATGTATRLDFSGGAFKVSIAPSASAGAAQTFADYLIVAANGDVYGTAGATGMTGGFFHISAGAGTPSGTPTNRGGSPIYHDATNHRLYVYNFNTGTWRYAALT